MINSSVQWVLEYQVNGRDYTLIVPTATEMRTESSKLRKSGIVAKKSKVVKLTSENTFVSELN